MARGNPFRSIFRPIWFRRSNNQGGGVGSAGAAGSGAGSLANQPTGGAAIAPSHNSSNGVGSAGGSFSSSQPTLVSHPTPPQLGVAGSSFGPPSGAVEGLS